MPSKGYDKASFLSPQEKVIILLSERKKNCQKIFPSFGQISPEGPARPGPGSFRAGRAWKKWARYHPCPALKNSGI